MIKAVILAGGKGTRMAPFTTVLPKPLLPVGDLPILEIVIRQLKYYGITDITLSVGYLGSLLEAYFGKGEKIGVKISYSYEQEPLGTAGPLALLSHLDSTFLVMNGDLLTTLNFSEMISFHQKTKRIATIGLAKKQIKIDLGVIETNPDSTLKKYIEKPTLDYLVSMGIYVFEPEILDIVRGAGRLDLPDLAIKLVDSGTAPMTYYSDCRWLDIGRPDDYARAVEVFESERHVFLKNE